MEVPDWMAAIMADVDAGRPTGISSVPANPEKWGQAAIDVVLARRYGLIQAWVPSTPSTPISTLGPKEELGHRLGIGFVNTVPEALATIELVLVDPEVLIEASRASFLQTSGAMLSTLTLAALAGQSNFYGLRWESVDGALRPVLLKRDRRLDATLVWASSLGGSIKGETIRYSPWRTADAPSLSKRIATTWNSKDFDA